MSLSELFLRMLAFGMVCGIIGFFLYVMLIWILSIIWIGGWIFSVSSIGGPGG